MQYPSYYLCAGINLISFLKPFDAHFQNMYKGTNRTTLNLRFRITNFDVLKMIKKRGSISRTNSFLTINSLMMMMMKC